MKNDIKSSSRGRDTMNAIRTGAVVATLSLSAMTSNVLADEVSVTDSTVTTEAVNENSTSVTADQVNEAQTAWNDSQSEVTVAQDQVDALESKVASTEVTIVDLEKELDNVDNLTETDVRDAQIAAENADREVDRLTNEVTETKTTSVVNDDAVAAQQKSVDDAQSEVNDLTQKVATVESVVSADTKALENANTTVDELKKTLDTETKSVAAQENEVDRLEKTVESAKLTLDSSATARDKAQSEYDVAKSAVDSAVKNGVSNIVPIDASISPEYVSLLNKIKRDNYSNAEDISKLDTLAISIGKRQFGMPDAGFQDEVFFNEMRSKLFNAMSDKDKATVIDLDSSLTDSQRMELGKFIIDNLNVIRRSGGLPEAVLNSLAMKAARMVEDHNTFEYDHDFAALTRVSDIIASPYTTYLGQNFLGESVGYIYTPTTKNFTMADLKAEALNQMLFMIFDDSHAGWGHSHGLLMMSNLMGVNFEKSPKGTYLRFGFYALPESYLEAVKVPKGTTLYSSSSDISKLNATLTSAQTALNAANSRHREADATYNSAKSTLDSVKSNLSASIKKLEVTQNSVETAEANAKLISDRLANSRIDLDKSKSALNTAKDKLKVERDRLEALKADKTSTLNNVSKVTQDLETAKKSASASSAKAVRIAEQYYNQTTAIEGLKTQLDGARSTLEGLRSRLADAKINLRDKESDAETKRTKYLELKSEYEKSLTTSIVKDIIKDSLFDKDSNVLTVDKTDGVVRDVDSNSSEKPPLPVIEKDQGTASTLVDDTVRGKEVDKKSSVSPSTSAPASETVHVKATTDNKLPDTGDGISVMTSLGMILTSLSAAVRLGKKRD